MCMLCGLYFYMPYSVQQGLIILGCRLLIVILVKIMLFIEPVINESSLRNNDRFHQRDRSMQKNKHKVIKQVYCVKRDGRLNKNSDLTLGKEKPVVEEQSVNSIDEIILHDDHGSNNIVEQCSNSAGGQDKKKKADNKSTGLTGHSGGLTGLTGAPSKSGNSSKIKTRPISQI